MYFYPIENNPDSRHAHLVSVRFSTLGECLAYVKASGIGATIYRVYGGRGDVFAKVLPALNMVFYGGKVCNLGKLAE